MGRVEFGSLVPCRACHGAGERVLKMTPTEQRERSRALRVAKRQGYKFDPAPLLKPCPDCAGKGYVPISVADRVYEGME